MPSRLKYVTHDGAFGCDTRILFSSVIFSDVVRGYEHNAKRNAVGHVARRKRVSDLGLLSEVGMKK